MELPVRYLCLAVALTSVLSQSAPELEEICKRYPTKHVVRHPADCSSYIECHRGTVFLRTCGQGLHYNELKGVCDYPELAGCVPGHLAPPPAALPPLPAHELVPPPIVGPAPRAPPPPVPGPPPNYRPRNYDVSPRITYEETVYGAGGRGIPDFRNRLRGYNTILMNDAKNYVRERMKGELTLFRQTRDIVDSGPFRMVSKFLNAKPYAKAISQPGILTLQAMKIIKKRFSGSGDVLRMMRLYGLDDLLKPLPGVYEPDTPMPIPPDIDYCPYTRHMSCHGKAITYRTHDGSCNNLNNPIWGRSMTPFSRLVPPRYYDGIEEMRRSVTGRPLPGARHVSFRLFPDADIPDYNSNMIMVYWGQLVDHDLTLTAITEVPTDEGLKDTREVKCGFDGCQTEGPGLDACWPIPVPRDDSDFPYNRCLKFVRSAEVPPLSCESGPREQLNQATHWLDTSMVYGVSKEDADKLREPDPTRGRMKVKSHPDASRYPGTRIKAVLPPMDDEVCREVNRTHACFSAGDERVNENAGLSVLHTIMVREHNRIEAALHRINPHWDGERLYQESRRILAAMSQHITYNEWLPLVLGKDLITKLDLEVLRSGYYYGYNPSVDPRVPNSFAAAAFRFGHTLLQERIRRMNAKYEADDRLYLSETFFRPRHTYSLELGGIDSIARGLANLPCQSYDQFFTKQVTNHLFSERPPFGPSMDLVSLNIQRGRDHGIGTYNDYREACGIGRAKTFDDLRGEVQDERALSALKKAYDHVDDIDLFAGGVSERRVPDGHIGPTFGCVIGRTFRAVRQGDRFWYENDNDTGFTPGQLAEIRKATMARVICANMDNMKEIQKWAFVLASKGKYRDNSSPLADGFIRFSDIMSEGYSNGRVPCDSLPDPDLSLWRDAHRY